MNNYTQNRINNILSLPALTQEEKDKAVKEQLRIQQMQMQSSDPNAEYP